MLTGATHTTAVAAKPQKCGKKKKKKKKKFLLFVAPEAAQSGVGGSSVPQRGASDGW